MIIRIWKKWFGAKAGQVKNVVSVETSPQTPTKTKKDLLSRRLEKFLAAYYKFRYNVLTRQAEVCALGDKNFRAVTQRVANTLCLEAQEQGIPCWGKDVLRLLNSERLTDFHPLLAYMAELPDWEGIDRVTPLAERISTEEKRNWLKAKVIGSMRKKKRN